MTLSTPRAWRKMAYVAIIVAAAVLGSMTIVYSWYQVLRLLLIHAGHAGV